MARTRSPNYPSMSLRQAIDQVRKVYMKEHTHKSPPDVVVKAMGYGGLNGSSAVALSALKKYGLLDEDGENLKVSTDALTILVDPLDSKERAEAIERAAFKPTLFSELQKEYGRSPPSDESLRAFLLKRGFHPESTDHPIKAYRDTLKLLTEQPEPKGDSPHVAFAVPIIGDEPKIEVGDVIQWEAAGALRLEAPRKVRAKAEHDGSWWLFVDGSETGIPMEEAVWWSAGRLMQLSASRLCFL